MIGNPQKPLYKAFDVREYVNTEKFDGFTRRGIRLESKEDAVALQETLAKVIKYWDS